jgi:hypothetical protein
MSTHEQQQKQGITNTDELARKKRDLVNRLLSEQGVTPSRMPIIPRPRDIVAPPLSFAQEGLWFIDRMTSGIAVYNTLLPLKLDGRLDVEILRRTLDQIVQRHEVLRTTFPEQEGRPIQIIAEKCEVPLPMLNLGDLPAQARETQIRKLITEELGAPFELASGPLFRAKLIRSTESLHVLLLSIHHIVFDAWSAAILCRELHSLYEAAASGRSSPLAELPIQYADYALWQRQCLQEEVLRESLKYWESRLKGSPALQLPTDRPRPVAPTFRGTREACVLSRELSGALRELSRREGVTLFMTMLAVFKVLLYRYSGHADIVVGIPVTMRDQPELEDLIGLFVNMAVIRTDLSGLSSFRDVLTRVRDGVVGAYDHVDVPFEKLVQELQPYRNVAQNPLFQVVFALDAGYAPGRDMSGITMSMMPETGDLIRFDIEVFVQDDSESISLQFACSTDLFDEVTTRRMLGHYKRLLEGVAADPDCRISQLPMLGEGERRRLLLEWNDTRTGYPREACIAELFEQQAAQRPQALAVVYGQAQLTYRWRTI